MGTIVKPYTFTGGTPALASEVNSNFDTIVTAINGNLDAANLANNAVGENELQDNAVATNKIAGLAVTEAKIGAAAVTNTKLGLLSVATGNIQDDAVTQPKIGPGAVGSTELASTAVTNAKLGLLAVATGNLQDDAVTQPKIGPAAVGNTELATDAVTNVKVSSSAAIAFSKMAALTASRLLVSNGSGVVTPAAGNIVDMWTMRFSVNSGGTPTYYINPGSWTVSRVSTGVYTVTHNLNSSNLTYFTTVDGNYDSQGLIIYAVEAGANTATVRLMAPDTTVLDNYNINLLVIKHA